MVGRPAGGLFRRHVFGSAHDMAQRRVGDPAKQLRDAEVGQLHGDPLGTTACGPGPGHSSPGPGNVRHARQRLVCAGRRLRHEQVRRLQVSVHDAVVVCDLERPSDLQRHGDRLPPGEPAAAAEKLFEALATDQFHREEGLVVLLAKCEQSDDPGMPQILEDIDFGIEP